MSQSSPIFAVILAAGKGTRMKSNRAKVLHTLCGVPMVNYVIDATRPLVPEGLFVVVGHQAELVEAVLPDDAEPVLQVEQRGTGDAVRVALDALDGQEEGVLLVVNGDGPLISDRTLGELVERHRSAGVGATVLVAKLDDPSGLGRVVEEAGVVRIVEERDASEAERRNRLVNLGLYAFGLSEIRDAIAGLEADNDQGELYLTDVLEVIGRRSRAVTYRLKNPEEANLVNDRAQLARAEEILRRRILDAHMRNGVTVRDPASTHIEASVDIGRDTVVLPGSFLRGDTTIGSDCVIGPSADLLDTTVADGAQVEHSVGRGATVGEGASVGPYSFLRPGMVLEAGSKVGAFCEVKNSRIGRGSKVPHLSYVGDAEIGEGVNLGAGTITANYDGENKNPTSIEDGAFTGINTNLIAPVKIGEDAYVGAGSVVNKDVPAGKLAVGAPARAIRESPQRRKKREREDGSRVQPGDNKGTGAVMHNGHLTQTTEKRLMVVSGEGYPELAERIAERLDQDLIGVELTEFANGELYARYLESVRGGDMFIVQSLCEPVNENLMQLLIMIDAAKRASAKRIVAVIPWYAYSRQDRKTKPREPITARLVANMIQAAGAERVMTMDLHSGQIEGYFTFPVDHLTAMHTFVDYFSDLGFRDATDAVVVAPDTGEVKVAKQLAGHLRLPWAIVNKMRDKPDSSEVTHVIGEVEGKRALMIDDVIATGGTLINAAERLVEHGATEVRAAATHGEFSGKAYEKIEDSAISEVVVTDTLPLKRDRPHSKIRTLQIAPIVASTIKNVFTDESVSEVFMGENQLF